jgi:hypothetical protein
VLNAILIRRSIILKKLMLLEMVMEISILVGNLPRAGCVVFVQRMSIFIIYAMVILPFVKISHEKNLFGKFTMKMSNFLENIP